MKPTSVKGTLSPFLWILAVAAWCSVGGSVPCPSQETTLPKGPAVSNTPTDARRFDTPQQAADVLIDAAEKFDVVVLAQIFGPRGEDIVFSGEYAQDRQHAANFVAEAREKKECFRRSQDRESSISPRRRRGLAFSRADRKDGSEMVL